MEVVFKCLADGKRYYGVWQNGQELFVGTDSECRRYREVHAAKVREEHLGDLRPQRGRPVAVRTYRALRMQG
ncbi:MAG: hypothetical protein R3F05_00080 [Planctomycetota bacterium]|nr:hypothetical protein [Planctomycetota bacterium]MCB9825529.1 hypothetical protein [Planctomycetota bacterium]MCB9900623.1 hypothetical protein [Planctomycetota bacterium]